MSRIIVHLQNFNGTITMKNDGMLSIRIYESITNEDKA
jgi:hypothetical protein